jgi:DNA/RNA-binding domain of Phe-tRNA-synthetase-like protein
MQQVLIDESITKLWPDIRLGCITANVDVAESSTEFLLETENVIAEIRDTLDISNVSQLPAIRDTKSAYRKFGKDPSRYRPSAEALLRRILNNKKLYRVSNVIDALNLNSLKYGFSIGGYDLVKINGEIILRLGRKDEDYVGIGRGTLNIENLPVLNDRSGAFGCPTSDSVRTMVTDETSKYMMIYFDFGNSTLLDKALQDSIDSLKKYCNATDISSILIEND